MFLLDFIVWIFSFLYDYFKPEKRFRLRLYNSISNRVEEFCPGDPKDVKIYCCGPTVYDVPHLGHARTYVFLDVLRRILRYHMGYGVRTVMNVTDLDDKIISRGGLGVARNYEKIFFETMASLNVRKPDFTPRVSEFLASAETLSKKCLEKGFAYRGLENENNIYLETGKYLKEYGGIFPRSEELLDSVRNPDKKDARDFALWKSKEWVDENNGRRSEIPGWHTECATMATDHFGKYVDIHLGGIDLRYPHHENEIALGRILLDEKDWVRFCVHAGHLQIDGLKMSKSKKNFWTVDDMLARGFSPLSIRYFLLKYFYSKPINFKMDELKKAQNSFENFKHHLKNINQRLTELKYKKENFSPSEDALLKLNEMKDKMNSFLMDNMNVPEALQTLENYVRELSSKQMKHLSYSWLKYVFDYVLWVSDKYFGLIEHPENKSDENEISVEEKLERIFTILKEFRFNVRKQALKQHKELLNFCDVVRKEMNHLGFLIEDN